jgi:hypothetical protein
VFNAGVGVPATGTTKGIMLWLAGGEFGYAACPPVLADTGGILPSRALTLCNTIAATGWDVMCPFTPGNAWSPNGALGLLYFDVNTDSGHGTRALATYLAWWDTLYLALRRTVSATLPIVPAGFSLNGFLTLLIAANRASDIAGYVAHHPSSVLSDINPDVTPGYTFSTLNSTGINVGASALNSVAVPGLLGWGSADSIIDYPNSGDLLTPAMYSAAHTAGASVSPNCDGTGTASAGSPTENHVLTSSTDNANPNNDVYQIAAWFHANLPHN